MTIKVCVEGSGVWERWAGDRLKAETNTELQGR